MLLLDEATSAIDPKTDALVQETIKTQFADRTVITVAHRIDTILHSDRVLVLDAGTVREFDAPDALLADRDSAFAGIVREAQLKQEKKTEKGEDQVL